MSESGTFVWQGSHIPGSRRVILGRHFRQQLASRNVLTTYTFHVEPKTLVLGMAENLNRACVTLRGATGTNTRSSGCCQRPLVGERNVAVTTAKTPQSDKEIRDRRKIWNELRRAYGRRSRAVLNFGLRAAQSRRCERPPRDTRAEPPGLGGSAQMLTPAGGNTH